jgi:hypothetical protein
MRFEVQTDTAFEGYHQALSRWSFNFHLTRASSPDTIGLQPMEFQFQPNKKRVSQIPSGFSRWSFSFSLMGKHEHIRGSNPYTGEMCDLYCSIRVQVVHLASRIRTHPVRGQGRAHLTNQVRIISIFFQPDVRTRALTKGDCHF